jgi:predicted enzyme related to lactoylglutathione lyase
MAWLGLAGLSGFLAYRPTAAFSKGTRTMAKITPNYLEMKASDLPASKAFYEQAFGFAFTDYGPDYAAVEGGPVDIGLAAGPEPVAPMPTFESDDLEASLAQVKAAGGAIAKDIFAFPGGRRFECLDPSGNRLAIYQPG